MKGLHLETLEELSEQWDVLIPDLQKLFEKLEAEGVVFQAKDEVSGKTLWFHTKELEDPNVQ